jgi:hypothetical protein
MRIRERALRCIKRDKKVREDGQRKDAKSQANSPAWHQRCRCHLTREGQQHDHVRPKEFKRDKSAMPCVAMSVAGREGETSKTDNGCNTNSLMIAMDNCCS